MNFPKSTPEQRERAAQTTSNKARSARRAREAAGRTCDWCHAPLVNRTRKARYCPGTWCRRKHVKHLRRMEVAYLRPNCLVCGARMSPAPNRHLSARTCGSKKCSRTAWNWFGPIDRGTVG